MTATLMLVSLALSGIEAAWSFARIVRGYRRLGGVPWLASLIFAAAAVGAVFALHGLLAG